MPEILPHGNYKWIQGIGSKKKANLFAFQHYNKENNKIHFVKKKKKTKTKKVSRRSNSNFFSKLSISEIHNTLEHIEISYLDAEFLWFASIY